jgi:putative transposase
MGWSISRGIDLKFTQPGKHSQNAFIERFNKTYCHEALNTHSSKNLGELRKITEN